MEPSNQNELDGLESHLRDALIPNKATVPGRLDDSILSMGAGRAAAIRRKRYLVRGSMAVAAGLAALALVLVWMRNNDYRYVAQDINRDGAVNILDAYSLHQTISTGDSELNRRWDFNRDGSVDDRDVDWLGNYVVRIKK